MYFKTKKIHADFYHIGGFLCGGIAVLFHTCPTQVSWDCAGRIRDTSCIRETAKGLSHQSLLLFSV